MPKDSESQSQPDEKNFDTFKSQEFDFDDEISNPKQTTEKHQNTKIDTIKTKEDDTQKSETDPSVEVEYDFDEI